MTPENKNNIHISFSEYSLAQQCQHRHLLEKYLKIYSQPESIHLYFGDSVHKCLEYSILNKVSIEERITFFKNLFTKNMNEKMAGTEDYKNLFPEFLKHGEAILRILLLDKALENYEVVCIEEQLYEKLYTSIGKNERGEKVEKNYFFKGFIDLVLRHKVSKRLLIVDYKTSTMPWLLKYKLSDKIFLSQMRFYKYFYARKHNIPLSEIDTVYTVLNRLKDKKVPTSFPGPIQKVPITASYDEIKESLTLLANTIKKIHIDIEFPKAKFRKNKQTGTYNEKYYCKFCPLKDGTHELCNSDPHQYKELLAKHPKP